MIQFHQDQFIHKFYEYNLLGSRKYTNFKYQVNIQQYAREVAQYSINSLYKELNLDRFQSKTLQRVLILQ